MTLKNYNVSYFLPNLPGSYTLLFFGNDSSNNLNKTESVTIVGTDSIKPKVFDLLPISNASYNVSDVIEISANVTDNYLVSLVSANITLPNSTIDSIELLNYSLYSLSNIIMMYLLKFITFILHSFYHLH